MHVALTWVNPHAHIRLANARCRPLLPASMSVNVAGAAMRLLSANWLRGDLRNVHGRRPKELVCSITATCADGPCGLAELKWSDG